MSIKLTGRTIFTIFLNHCIGQSYLFLFLVYIPHCIRAHRKCIPVSYMTTLPIYSVVYRFFMSSTAYRFYNETISGQNKIFFYLKLRDLGRPNFRYLEHILTVPSSSSERSSTVYNIITDITNLK
jgi:hypothetical protein